MNYFSDFFFAQRFFSYNKASLPPVKSSERDTPRLQLRLESGSLLRLENQNRLFLRFVACCQEAPGAHHAPGPINLPFSSIVTREKWLMFGHGFSSSSFSSLSLSWLFFRSISQILLFSLCFFNLEIIIYCYLEKPLSFFKIRGLIKFSLRLI